MIDFQYNKIEFQWAAPYFEQEDQTMYSYNLKGFDNQWTEWSRVVNKEFTNLRYGKYTMQVKQKMVWIWE